MLLRLLLLLTFEAKILIMLKMDKSRARRLQVENNR
jgi:hypothetical protein